MAGLKAGDGAQRNGRIVTFYSYKGGTGRTMAAVNTAYLFARGDGAKTRSVLVIDWDLEAPGVPKYVPGVDADHNGLIDFFFALRERLDDGEAGKALYAAIFAADRSGGDEQRTRRQALSDALDAAVPLLDYVQLDVGDPGSAGRLAVLSSGRAGEDYAKKVTSFHWPEFFEKYPSVFAALPERLASAFDYVIVDSRTGVTDASGICSVLLPERLVCVFTPNRQSLEGGIDMMRRALTHRRTAALDSRPLIVYPLPSRVENSEAALREEWRGEYQRSFEQLFKECYEEDDCDLTRYFDEIKAHHRSDYAYGEKIAVLTERDEDGSLTRAFRKFATWLDAGEVPWGDVPSPPEASAMPLEQLTAGFPAHQGKRPFADAVRAWRDHTVLLSGMQLQKALSWAAMAGYLYPSELELVTRSLGAEHRVLENARRNVFGALIGCTVMVLGLGAFAFVSEGEAVAELKAELAQRTVESQVELKDQRAATQSARAQAIRAQAETAEALEWLAAISRSELLLDDMKDLSFDQSGALPSPEIFEEASQRLDDLAEEMPKLATEVAKLIKDISSDSERAPQGAFDPLPALQHAADRLQQAGEQLEPLSVEREKLKKKLEKAHGPPVSDTTARAAARLEWNEGHKAFLQGDYQKAQERFEAALKADPTYEGAFNSLGRLALMRGDLLKAREYLESALANDPRHPVAMANLAVLYVMQALPAVGPARQVNLAKARALIDRSIQLDPGNNSALNTRKRIETLEAELKLSTQQQPLQGRLGWSMW